MRIQMLCSTALMGVLGLATAATAQQITPAVGAPTTPPAVAAPGAIQDIVVTAQRTSSSIQKTPISIQAYTGQQLTARGVTDISGLATADSSVNINYSTSQPIIAIRGVSSQDTTETGDPAVSIASDGIFTNRPYGVFGGLYDVERVEILRGPQGTLFGRNSTGGTINIITARPTSRNEAQFIGEVGNYNLFGAQGFANYAITDGLNARFSFDARTHQGYRDNGPASGRGDDQDIKSGRFQLGFQPTDALKGWILAEYTQQGGAGPVEENVPFSYLNGVGGEPVHTFPAGKSDGHSFPFQEPYLQSLRHWELRGGLTYTLPDGISLNYLGGFDSIRYTRQQSLNPEYGGVGNGPLPVPLLYNNTQKPDTINQEIRISSSTSGRWFWQVGGYFFHERNQVYAYTAYNALSNIEQRGIAFDYPKITSNSKALYAQSSFAITDQLKVSGGVRYTWDKKSRDGSFYIYPGQTGLPFTITVGQEGRASSSKATWSGGLDYQITPRNLLYGKVSSGYKAGGFNDATSTYGPESVISYEIGSKNSFLENHLQLNLTGFRMDYKNQQVSQFVSGAASSGSITVNAGKSRIWGAELNLVAQDATLGRFELSGNYTHARYLDFVASAGWDSTINLDLSGNRLPLSPTWSFAGMYERPIELSSGGTITPRINVKYQTKQYFGANNYPDQAQGGYALVDLGLDYTPPSKIWSLQLYVKNVADKTILSDATEFYLFNNYNYAYQPPRTFGGRVIVNFK